MGLAATARHGLTVPTRSSVHVDPGSVMSSTTTALRTLRRLGRWVLLGSASGVLAGLACWVFLTALDRATEVRLDTPTLLWLLPLAGLGIGSSYHLFGGRAGEGNALLLDEIHRPTAWVPRRMAPMVGLGTIVSHLFGASVGREGTALQMSGSLSDWMARTIGLRAEDRRVLLTAALGGGFGAVFGVPLAGAIFGLEVQRVAWHGRTRFLAGLDNGWTDRVIATLVASFVGNQVVHGLGYHHTARPRLTPAIDLALLGRVALLAVAFGLAAMAFIEGTDLVRAAMRRGMPWAPARPMIGGLLVLGGVALVGRSYLGLSLPLIDDALAGGDTDWKVPLLKLAFTTLCLGAGYIGGEVTPLFVIGTTLGSALAPAIGLDPVVGGAVGFVAVFGGATNTPVACAVMAAELFGGGILAPAAVGCAVTYLCSGSRGIYATQIRIGADGPTPVSARPALAERLKRGPHRRSPS